MLVMALQKYKLKTMALKYFKTHTLILNDGGFVVVMLFWAQPFLIVLLPAKISMSKDYFDSWISFYSR